MTMLLGLFFSIAIVSFISLLMGVSASMIDMPSLIFVMLPGIFIITVTGSYKNIFNYIKHSFNKNHVFSINELECLSCDLKALIKITMASGAFTFVAGMIAILHNLNDPSSLGPNLSVCLITVLYAIVFSYFILYPAKIWADRKLLLYTAAQHSC